MPGDFERDQVLRLVQLNIGSLFEPDWDRRRVEIVSWIDHLDPDVVCLQEVAHTDTSPNAAGWIADEAATDFHMAFGGHELPEKSWPDRSLRFGSAVLSRWPIDNQALHRLPLAPNPAPFTAGMPWELFHASTAGLDLFSTHLAAAPADAHHRLVQVQAIDDIIRETRGDVDDLMNPDRRAMPPILCGDFNAEPDSDEIRFLSSTHVIDGRATFYQDAWKVAGDGSAGLTNDWRSNYLAANLNVHRKRIDYVFVGDPFLRKGSGGRILNAQLAFDEERTGIIASDHKGLAVEINWPDRPTAPLEG